MFLSVRISTEEVQNWYIDIHHAQVEGRDERYKRLTSSLLPVHRAMPTIGRRTESSALTSNDATRNRTYRRLCCRHGSRNCAGRSCGSTADIRVRVTKGDAGLAVVLAAPQ